MIITHSLLKPALTIPFRWKPGVWKALTRRREVWVSKSCFKIHPLSLGVSVSLTHTYRHAHLHTFDWVNFYGILGSSFPHL